MDDVARTPTAPLTALLPEEQAWLGLPSVLTDSVRHQLLGMFRDPHMPGSEEREQLIAELREAIAVAPAVPELRVLLCIVLCASPTARGAQQELRDAMRRVPYNFAARLKLGELLMRLRIWDQAAEQTRMAADLAANGIQADAARRQAAMIRSMQRGRIARGGKAKVLAAFSQARRRLSPNSRTQPQE